MCADPAHRFRAWICVNCCCAWSSREIDELFRIETPITVSKSTSRSLNDFVKNGLLRCSVSRQPRIRLETVLDDLAIERSAADGKETRRFLKEMLTSGGDDSDRHAGGSNGRTQPS